VQDDCRMRTVLGVWHSIFDMENAEDGGANGAMAKARVTGPLWQLFARRVGVLLRSAILMLKRRSA
jgi:hypothetical protein